MMGHGWLFVEAVMMGCATILARGMYSRPIFGLLVGRRNWTLGQDRFLFDNEGKWEMNNSLLVLKKNGELTKKGGYVFVTFFVCFWYNFLANTLINSPLRYLPKFLSLSSVCVCNYLFIGKIFFGLKAKQT
jgi:hypothetical protein